ncbi:fimbrial protein [Providencia sp. PROV202]|uniref:fimbrial protein n=1 Tax=Providencia sp. PROV202 TaxID=2949902 RepID=UPI00234AB681|nr:fimbrial protein [Providencia sp. PROV202]
MLLLNSHCKYHNKKKYLIIFSWVFSLLLSVQTKADNDSIRFEFTAYVDQEPCEIIVEDLYAATDEIDFGIVSMQEIIEQTQKKQFEIILQDCEGDFSTSSIKITSGSTVDGSNDYVFNSNPDAYFGVAIMDEDEQENFAVGDTVFDDIEDGDEHIILTAVLACYNLGNSCSEDDVGEFTAHVTFSYFSD